MKKEEVIRNLISELSWIGNNELLNADRKTDQGYGYSQALISIFPEYFDDLAEIYQNFNMAINPAYKPTFDEWKAKYVEKK